MAGENQRPSFEFLLQEYLLNGERQEVLFLLFYAIILMGKLGPFLSFQLGQYIPCAQHCFLSPHFYVDLFCFSQVLHTLAPSCAAVNFAHRNFPSAFTLPEQFPQISMLYSPYTSVCHALCYYSVIMSRMACSQLVMTIFAHGFLSVMICTVSTSQLFFFDCPDPQILTLASLDTCPQGNQLFIIGTVSFTSSLLTVLISFVCILTVFKILSSKRRFKTFSSCVSPFSVASLFYETSFFVRVTVQFNFYSEL